MVSMFVRATDFGMPLTVISTAAFGDPPDEQPEKEVFARENVLSVVKVVCRTDGDPEFLTILTNLVWKTISSSSVLSRIYAVVVRT